MLRLLLKVWPIVFMDNVYNVGTEHRWNHALTRVQQQMYQTICVINFQSLSSISWYTLVGLKAVWVQMAVSLYYT